eukprot:jgi/Mesen1/1851/ME000143S00899
MEPEADASRPQGEPSGPIAGQTSSVEAQPKVSSAASHGNENGSNTAAANVGPKNTDRTALPDTVVLPKYLAVEVLKALTTGGVKGAPTIPADVAAREEARSTLEAAPQAPSAPLLVFINSRSGGGLGTQLYKRLQDLLGPAQVYDLAQVKPTEVLKTVVGCLDDKATAGDACAGLVRARLRILVAGGDGTVGWILASFGAMDPVPPVGVIPLGTGNDLSRLYGWGATFGTAAEGAVRKRLLAAASASQALLDSWQVMVLPPKDAESASLKLPHAMQPQQHVPLPPAHPQQAANGATSGGNGEAPAATAFVGRFWNYLSLGMDAQIAYGFHHLREKKPWLARGRFANQMIYGGYGCGQGWFCTPCSIHPRARSIGMMAQKEWVEARPHDGLLELVGFHDGWHTAAVLGGLISADRLIQAHGVKMELRGEYKRRAYLQMDGEPWQQPLVSGDREPTLIEITKTSRPTIMLATPGAKALGNSR